MKILKVVDTQKYLEDYLALDALREAKISEALLTLDALVAERLKALEAEIREQIKAGIIADIDKEVGAEKERYEKYIQIVEVPEEIIAPEIVETVEQTVSEYNADVAESPTTEEVTLEINAQAEAEQMEGASV